MKILYEWQENSDGPERYRLVETKDDFDIQLYDELLDDWFSAADDSEFGVLYRAIQGLAERLKALSPEPLANNSDKE